MEEVVGSIPTRSTKFSRNFLTENQGRYRPLLCFRRDSLQHGLTTEDLAARLSRRQIRPFPFGKPVSAASPVTLEFRHSSPALWAESIAEAYAFGAATSRNIEGRFLSALINGEPEAQEAWSAIAQYNHFLLEHRELYHQAAPVARIALISADPHNPLADEFLTQSVFLETKVLAHLDKGVPLDRFKVLVMPADLPRLSTEQKARLHAFTAGGGVIITDGKPKSGIVARAEAAAEGPRLSLEPRGYVLGQLTRKPDGRTFVLHLLNYDHQAPAENVKVRLNLSGLDRSGPVDLRETKDLTGWEVNVLSPDATHPEFAGLSLHRNVIEFTLSRIQHYTVVTLSARPGP